MSRGEVWVTTRTGSISGPHGSNQPPTLTPTDHLDLPASITLGAFGLWEDAGQKPLEATVQNLSDMAVFNVVSKWLIAQILQQQNLCHLAK